MQLLSPLWLFAALGVVIPLVYHLRRNTPPEVIRVGSVADLGTGAALANRRVPRDLLLLVTRCALLTLTAVALARPNVETAREGRRWIVAPSGEWSVVDSLEASGAVLANTPESRFPWSSATAAAAAASASDTLLLVAPDDGTRWIGPRPHVAHVTMAIGVSESDGPPGPPLPQRVASASGTDAAAPPHDASLTLWWALLALVPLERALARNSRDAG
jgi:hypothetical protein